MPSERQITKLLTPGGFMPFAEPGFLGFDRVHDDGRYQQVHVFWWANAKVAIAEQVPSAYLVICPALDALRGRPRQEDERIRLPLVMWPAPERVLRPWHEVVTEFNEVIVPILDSPLELGRELLTSRAGRYRLECTGPASYTVDDAADVELDREGGA